jgi:hypothetical protein
MAASTPPLRVAVWDARRGDKEGREQEKMLCYYPSSIPVTSQINHVGFAQACAMFAEHFADGVGGSDGAFCAGVPAGAERARDPDARARAGPGVLQHRGGRAPLDGRLLRAGHLVPAGGGPLPPLPPPLLACCPDQQQL